ncbi:MAG: DMT family transporter [Blastocatellia bacterium]|nr:DMT family transporter [Blastocatellia bacterium]
MPPSDDSYTHQKIAYLHMLWASVSFAVMAAVSHWAGQRCDWQLVAVARASIAFFFSVIIAKASSVKLVILGPRTLWMRSLAGSTGILCNFYALSRLPVSDTLTLMNTSPIWVTLILWFIFKQKPTTGIVIAVLTSVAGIVLIQQPHFQSGKFACFMALCGSFCTSIAMIGLNRLQSIDPRAIVAHFSGVASVATAAFLTLTSNKDYSAQLSGAPILFLLVLVGLAGVAGQLGMTLAFAKGQASRVSVVALSQILFGLIFEAIFLRRTVNTVSLLGMIFVTVPTAWLIISGATASSGSGDLVAVELKD